MPERSTLTQVVQAGPEATPGDPAAVVTKKFQTLAITPTISAQVDTFKAAGAKYTSINSLSKEWSTAAVAGRGSYTEMIYLLNGALNTGVITTPGGGTLSRNHTITANTYATDTPKTFVIEHGSAERAALFRYGMFTEYGIAFSRNGIEVTGAMLGKAISDGVTLTSAGVTEVELIPILPGQVSVYIDSTAAGLGSTKMLRVVSAAYKISNRFNPVWILDAAQTSFAAHVETEPTCTLELVLEADAQGMALLTGLRAGSKSFIRIESIGSIIEAAIPYRYTLDFCGSVSQPQGYSDQDGLFAVGWTFNAVHDSTWGKSQSHVLTNKITALT